MSRVSIHVSNLKQKQNRLAYPGANLAEVVEPRLRGRPTCEDALDLRNQLKVQTAIRIWWRRQVDFMKTPNGVPKERHVIKGYSIA